MTRYGLCLASLAILAGCSRGARPDSEPLVLRLGYFPNVTHAPGIVAVEEGFAAEELGPNVKLETHTFNAGPEVVEAIFSNALDISYVGPNPAINGYAQSRGQALRIIAGATSGGAAKPDRRSSSPVSSAMTLLIRWPATSWKLQIS